MRIDGKNAIVTGAGSGIGRAIAVKLAEAGAHVAVTDMDLDRASETANSLVQRGLSAQAFRMDVCSQADLDAVRDALAGDSRAPSIIVNNAGWDILQPFVKTTPDFWRKVVEINFLGQVAVIKTFLDAMIASGAGGKIVNVASDAGRVGSSGESVYAGAKGGVIAFTKSLARELARNRVNVNCVCPGPTETPLLRANPDNYNDALLRAIPFKRFADPGEIADAVLFFASDQSSYVTGQVLSVSGGLTMVG